MSWNHQVDLIRKDFISLVTPKILNLQKLRGSKKFFGGPGIDLRAAGRDFREGPWARFKSCKLQKSKGKYWVFSEQSELH